MQVLAAVAEVVLGRADAVALDHTDLFRRRRVQYLSRNLTAGLALD